MATLNFAPAPVAPVASPELVRTIRLSRLGLPAATARAVALLAWGEPSPDRLGYAPPANAAPLALEVRS